MNKTSSLAPIRRRSLGQETLERLRKAILGGVLPAGSPVPAEAAAAKFVVSRVPVREPRFGDSAERLAEI
jgi:DNA-binding GntR family transcriptional regulator